MRTHLILLPVLAVAFAYLVQPEAASSFVKRGDSLATDQRDFRVFNNFADPETNDNVVPSTQFPGALGAVLAIWKGAAEWGSGPHGNGRGDFSQVNLGDGGANFDFAFGGLANGVGTTNNNIVSALSNCNLGLLSFVETPTTNGWRIRFCDNNNLWGDGPGPIPSGTFDLQGQAAHMFGLALGLNNSSVAGATVTSSPSFTGNVQKRSLHADDIAGVQCIYGVASPGKPVISDVLGSGPITIRGSNFAATGNTVWFTSATSTPTGVDPIVRLADVPSSNGGTRMDVVVPSAAGPGDVLVKLPGPATGDLLSNAFPWPIASCFTNRDLPSERGPLDPVLADTGGSLVLGPKVGDATETFNLSLDCATAPGSGVYTIVLRLGHSATPAVSGFGFFYCAGPRVFRCAGSHAQNSVECIPGGLVLPNDPSLIGLGYCQQGFCGSSGGGRLSNAIVATVGG